MKLATDQVLQARYHILSMLGQGGMGAVYRARDTRLSIPVAIKEMTPQPGIAPHVLAQLRQQFQQEATLLARLDHPHLVAVTDFFEEDGNAYLVMKFIKGESLAEHIESLGAIPEDETLVWADQLGDALAYCHAQGVIHRDVNPENVIIRPDGRAVLVDFGLVKLWDPGDPHTRTVMRGMGTPQYAPPEQYDAQTGHTDPRADIYSLGATLYHALTGQPPPTATQRIARRSAFQAPRALNKHISSGTEAAVLRAMELTVEDRFLTVREMVEALRGTVPDLSHPAVVAPERARRASQTQPQTRPQVQPWAQPHRRVPVWAWMVGGLVVLAVAMGLTMGRVMKAVPPGDDTTPAPAPTVTATVTPVPAHAPSGAPTHTPTLMPTGAVTPRPTSTPARTPTLTPTHTPTPQPSLTATPIPPRSIVPELTAPAQGGGFKSPIAFQWHGSLNAGQAYQVTARHPESSYVIQSELSTNSSWTAHLPAERYGEWRWAVSVMQSGRAVTTSDEWMFWFDPGGGGGDNDGGGGGGGDKKPTKPPP